MVQVPDLLGYLLDDYLKTTAQTPSEEATLKAFVEASRELLKKDPPVGIDYSIRGLGVTMTGGRKLALLPQAADSGLQEDNLYEPEIPVTFKNRQ